MKHYVSINFPYGLRMVFAWFSFGFRVVFVWLLYGFRMVFQSYEKTLTDIEVNSIMDNITNKIKENPDWQVR